MLKVSLSWWSKRSGRKKKIKETLDNLWHIPCEYWSEVLFSCQIAKPDARSSICQQPAQLEWDLGEVGKDECFKHKSIALSGKFLEDYKNLNTEFNISDHPDSEMCQEEWHDCMHLFNLSFTEKRKKNCFKIFLGLNSIQYNGSDFEFFAFLLNARGQWFA